MNFLKIILYFLLLTLLPLFQFSCINKHGINLPLNVRKLKNKVRPPHEFGQMVMDYRYEKSFWPKSELDLISADRHTVNALYAHGFTDWHLGDSNSDSLYVHFTHEPVFEDAHVGVMPITGRNVKIKTLYIYSSGIIKTELVKRQ